MTDRDRPEAKSTGLTVLRGWWNYGFYLLNLQKW